MAEKFLVLWRLELGRLSPEAVRGVMRMQEYGARLENEGKVLSRYHLVGSHGGAWRGFELARSNSGAAAA